MAMGAGMAGKANGAQAGAEPLWALGLMSGTSMDGVDAAMVQTDGETIAAFGPSIASDFTPDDIRALSAVAADWRPYRPARDAAHRATLAAAEREVLRAHAAAVMACLGQDGDGAEPAMPSLIGFHGQTVAHAPEEGWTWQLGDGAALARMLNRPVVWDFRSDDMKAGGEGAPLAPFFHWALARHIGADRPVAFLNIGGVANVTWVDPLAAAPEAPGALLAFDTGPGNALINDLVARKTGAAMDRDGALAAKGAVNEAALRSNAAGAYLERRPPKSLDRNAFAPILSAVEPLAVADGAATLTAFTADCVARAERWFPSPPARWLVCGGGRRNATIMGMLSDRLNAPVEAVEAAGLNGDMLEAQAFAWLAVRVARGLPTSAPGTTGCAEPVSGGRLSEPA